MTTIYAARWVLPMSAPPIENGAVAIDNDLIVGVGVRSRISEQFVGARVEDFGDAAILPGLINTHTHLELTSMRGYLEREESIFIAWLKKLTQARMNLLTPQDIEDSASWGACEAARAGITCVGDASASGFATMNALKSVGLRATLFQESFGVDPRLAEQNLQELRAQVSHLREIEDDLVTVGVSPHSPYTVSGPQLEMIARYAAEESLPVMMHAAESAAEESLLLKGSGFFADNLASRDISWDVPGVSTIQYLRDREILATQPLLAHCIRVDKPDIETLAQTGSKVAHCPKSNAKLLHGHAPFGSLVKSGIAVGLGSDSVASNNTCDILEESRFAVLMDRAFDSQRAVTAEEALLAATVGGAQCMGLAGKIGELREGANADLTVVSLNNNQQVPIYDPISALVFSSSGRDVVRTVVAGKEVFREGLVTAVDEERLGARMREIATKLSQL